MKLSILDQSPISAGKTAQDALKTSIKLAQLGETYGYERYWITEHHSFPGLACPNPDVMLGVIGSQTKKIRLGAGAVLLPYYKPYQVAETYNLLATLFPERIDLGIGRAPGGSAEVSLALSENYLKQVKQYEEDLDQLHQFLHNEFPKDHMFNKIKPYPVPATAPQLWLLGTSQKSATLAAEKGMFYAFGHFMTDQDGPKITHSYRKYFKSQYNPSKVIVAIHAICAQNQKKAEQIASSYFLWNISQKKTNKHTKIPTIKEAQNYSFSKEELEDLEKMKRKMVIGSPKEVKKKILHIQEQYDADEIMIITITHDEEAKFKSYRFIAEQLL